MVKGMYRYLREALKKPSKKHGSRNKRRGRANQRNCNLGRACWIACAYRGSLLNRFLKDLDKYSLANISVKNF